MKFIVRNVNVEDFQEILKLNESLVHFLSPLNQERLIHLDQNASLHKVVEVEGDVVAFLLAFRENADYDSVNYQWFNEKYEQFLYVDRIVVDTNYHHLGIGKELYNYIKTYAKKYKIPRITAEIDIKPENPISLAFHRKSGFIEVGQQVINEGKKIVSLQSLELEY